MMYSYNILFAQGSDLSAITSLYILSCLVQVVGGRSMVNNVAGVIVHHFSNLNVRVLSEGNASDGYDGVKPFSKWLNEVERIICYAPESKGSESTNGNYLGAHLEDFMSSFNISSSSGYICSKRLVFSQVLSFLLVFSFVVL